MQQPGGTRDLTVLAVPFYFAAMGAEHLVLRRRAARQGPGSGDYEWRDTVASLSLGVGSLLAPLVVPKLLGPLTPGRGRYGRVLLVGAAGAAAVTSLADQVARRAGEAGGGPPAPGPRGDGRPTGRSARRRSVARWSRRVASVGALATVATAGVAVTTAWAALTTPERLWAHRRGTAVWAGPAAVAAAVLGWDFIYYWNHRFMHESRYMWALHVVHHSSQRYNLSTALRQPVADALGTFVPSGALCVLGAPPGLVATARGVNLLYQFWIHTETIGRLGPAERILNTPSLHRVHHGSNRQYLDRNHGSILIVWDRLFGTYEPEGDAVVYGLTTNVGSFDPLRIATHEYAAMLGDVARSTSWADRLSHVVRGPGWGTRSALAAPA